MYGRDTLEQSECFLNSKHVAMLCEDVLSYAVPCHDLQCHAANGNQQYHRYDSSEYKPGES